MDKHDRYATLALKTSFATMSVALLSRPSTAKFWRRISTVAYGATVVALAAYFHNFYKIAWTRDEL
jgi:hypothetical protein